MSFQADTAFIQQYTMNVAHLLQQRGSKLRRAVMTSTAKGKAAKVVEQIGPVTAQRRTSKHADTPLISTPHAARWCHPKDYEYADLVDDQDKLRMLIDPTSDYAKAGAMSLGRSMDDEIIAEAFGTARVGEDGDVLEAFDTANQQIAAGGTGMSVNKLRTAKEILISNEVDLDFDPLYLAIGSKQHENLLAETQAISLDFNDKPVLVEGRIKSFMGFNFIDIQRLGVDGAAARRNIAWAKSGLHLCIWGDIEGDIGPRRDKSNATQVYAKATFGATRTENGKVIEILSVET